MSSTVEKIRRWGGLATDALLDSSTLIFETPEIEGLIGYRVSSGCAVVFGDPVCAMEKAPALALAFQQFCKMPIIYLMASQHFANWARKEHCKAVIQYGEELSINPQNDPRNNHGTQASLVRRKVRRAIKEGVTIKEHQLGDAESEKLLTALASSWLQKRQGAQIHISHVSLFEYPIGKRWFYALQNGKIIGMLVINRLESHNGWLMNHLMKTHDAPQGTQEMLVISVLEILKNEGCTYTTFGVAPGETLSEVTGLNGIFAKIIRFIYKIVYRFFHLQGLKMFWGKFHPDASPSYLLFSRPHIGIKEIKALMSAMNVSVKK